MPIIGFLPGGLQGSVAMDRVRKDPGDVMTSSFKHVAAVDLDRLETLEKAELVKALKAVMSGGISLSFSGKRSAMEIARRVRPRVTKVVRSLSVGPAERQAENLLVEGENLQAMVTLYKYRGQIDLIVTDPPYNTGTQFRYNDKWDDSNPNYDPNDSELGSIVALEDGSRHTKWMKVLLPRLLMMKSMLRQNGVIAICIDENELFHLGMIMDEVFGESNRLGIINWQKKRLYRESRGYDSQRSLASSGA